MNGPESSGSVDRAHWSLLGVGIVGSFAMAAGAIAGLVSWIGALLNVSQSRERLFVVLLLLGIFNSGSSG